MSHTIEPELAGPTPRRVRLRGGLGAGCGLWFIRLFILPHTLAGVFILGQAVWGTGLYFGIWLFGDEYPGAVTNKSARPGRQGKTVYALDYEYMVAGQLYTGRASVNAEEYQETAEGDRFSIRALESAPTSDPWARLPGQTPLWNVGGRWLIALFWNGILSVFLWHLYVRPWQMRRLVRRGRPAAGIVRGAWRTPGNKQTTYDLTYEYAVTVRLVGEPAVYTAKMTSGQSSASGAKPGDVVTVLYDPRTPARSLVYKYADYEAR